MAASSREEAYVGERLALETPSGVINQTAESVHRYTDQGRFQLDITPDPTTQITCFQGPDIHVSTSLSPSDPEVLSAITSTDLLTRLRILPVRRWAVLTDLLLTDESERIRQYKHFVFENRRAARERELELSSWSCNAYTYSKLIGALACSPYLLKVRPTKISLLHRGADSLNISRTGRALFGCN